MPIKLLFLNTRDQCGADVAVHLMLMTNFAPNEAEIFVISNSEALDAAEMRVRFAGMPHVTSMFMPLGKPAQALSGRSKLGRVLAYGPSAASLAKIAAFVRKHRIQVIHATDRPRDASYVSLLGYLTRAVSVVHMHAPASNLSRATLWGMRHSTAIFAVSDFIRVGLIQVGLEAEKIYTVHNAVDSCHFDPDKALDSSPSIREQFGIPRDALMVGIAARMNPWKGQYELIGAVSRLRGAFPNLHVLILGADVPEMRADYERRAREGGIADRLHFGGFQTDVRPFLHEFDLFVHPSYGEPFGLSIVEAMAMRKPVIACNTGGVPEIITHGKDGWLVEERSAEAVAAAMTTLLNDEEMKPRDGQAGQGNSPPAIFASPAMCRRHRAVRTSDCRSLILHGSRSRLFVVDTNDGGLEVSTTGESRGSDEIGNLKQEFGRNGYFVLRNIVSPELLNDLHKALAKEFDRASKSGGLFSGGGQLSGHLNCFPGERARFAYDTLMQGGIIELVKQLHPNVLRMPNVGLNFNLPGSHTQHYHIDRPFTREFMIANVAVVDTVVENGAIELVPGTHKRFYKYTRFVIERRYRDGVRVPINRGDVLIRSSNVWHRGMTNRTFVPRPMLAFTWEDGGSNEQDPFGASGGHIRFLPNWFRPTRVGRLREQLFVKVPITYSALRFARSLLDSEY